MRQRDSGEDLLLCTWVIIEDLLGAHIKLLMYTNQLDVVRLIKQGVFLP